MTEIARFLASLEHENPCSPKFTFSRGSVETMLVISFNGQQLEVPAGEVLGFARRWYDDFEDGRPTAQAAGQLHLFPYPLMRTTFNDPDCKDLAWEPDSAASG